MAFENGEGAINLLEENDAGEFVGQRHLAEGDGGGGGFAGLVGETVGRTDGQHERLRVAVLMVLEKLCEIFGGKRLASRVEEDEGVGGMGPHFFAQLQESGFIGEHERLDWSVAGDALEIFVGEGLDGGIFGFADPGDFEFHG